MSVQLQTAARSEARYQVHILGDFSPVLSDSLGYIPVKNIYHCQYLEIRSEQMY